MSTKHITYAIFALLILALLCAIGGFLASFIMAPSISDIPYRTTDGKLFKNYSIVNNDDGSRTITIIGYYQSAIPAYGFKYIDDNLTIKSSLLSEFGATTR